MIERSILGGLIRVKLHIILLNNHNHWLETKRSSIQNYDYCKTPRHDIERIYKLHRLPPHLSGNRDKRSANMVQNTPDDSYTGQPETKTMIVELYNQLMSLLNK